MPDRSKQLVRHKKDEDGVIDIGWCDGVLSDGRAFRAEMWAQDQVSVVTIFFSALGMESLDKAAMTQFVQSEGLIAFRRVENRYCDSTLYTDDAGRRVWSVNVVIGSDDETYLAGSMPIFPFSETGDPNTMFNPTPIKAAHRP